MCVRQLSVAGAHVENVALLPFTDEAMAASVGATVEELNAEPISPLAAEVVFDALCGSMSGVAYQERCDTMRSSFVDSETGGFDASRFGSALDEARSEIGRAVVIFPGLPLLVLLLVANKWAPVALEYARGIGDVLEASVAESPAALLLPAWAALGVVFTLLLGTNTRPGPIRAMLVGDAALTDADGRPLDYKERAILEQDECAAPLGNG